MFRKSSCFCKKPGLPTKKRKHNIRPNVLTSFNKVVRIPKVSPNAYIDPQSVVIGNVYIGENVYVAPFSSVRGDEGQPIWVGNNSNIQEGVVLHALETEESGETLEGNLMEVDNKKYAVYIGNKVTLAHQSQIHGPAVVEDDCFIGMQAFVFKSRVGKGCVIEPGAKIIGVKISDNHYVPTGSIITSQLEADKLPKIHELYAFRDINKGVLHVNEQLAKCYLDQDNEESNNKLI